jgi:hypothetical protein
VRVTSQNFPWAVILAGVGLFGAVAYAVQSRTRKFSVRLRQPCLRGT